MRSWRHSGFNVNASVRIGAADATGRENLARYLIRAPFSMNKIRYDSAAQTVIYKTKMVAGPNRNFEIFDPLDFLAAVTSHIPNRGEHLVRYYGYYSSSRRGRRRRQGREHVAAKPMQPADDVPHAKAARASWARFIKRVFAADRSLTSARGNVTIPVTKGSARQPEGLRQIRSQGTGKEIPMGAVRSGSARSLAACP